MSDFIAPLHYEAIADTSDVNADSSADLLPGHHSQILEVTDSVVVAVAALSDQQAKFRSGERGSVAGTDTGGALVVNEGGQRQLYSAADGCCVSKHALPTYPQNTSPTLWTRC